MKRNKTLRLDEDMLDKLQSSADQRGMVLTAVIEEACRQYLGEQELRSSLADMEERMAATLLTTHREVTQVFSAVQMNMAMIDQLAKFMFFNTDEMPAAEEDAALIREQMRHSAFVAEMPNSYDSRKRRARIVLTIEEREAAAAEQGRG